MRPAVWLVLAVPLLLLAGVLWWPEETAPPRRPPASRPKPALRKTDPVTVPQNYSWKDAPEKELRNIVSNVADRNAAVERKPFRNFKMDFFATSGESIIADAYEGRPGEFVFCKMTPTIKTRDDGTSVVEVEVDSFTITVSGEQRELYSNYDKKHELEPGGTVSMTDQVDEGGFNLRMWGVQILGDGQSLRLSAAGEYKAGTAPSANDDSD